MNDLYPVKILFYDTETTGLDPKLNAIHQIAYSYFVAGKFVESSVLYLRPHDGAVVDEEAIKHSNVTSEQIMAYPEPIKAFNHLKSKLYRWVNSRDKKDKIFLCGYNNGKFDDEFLRMLWIRSGDKYFGSNFFNGPIDLFPIASLYLMKVRHEMPGFKQSDVARMLGIDVDDTKLHDAIYDLHILVEIFKVIVKDINFFKSKE